MKTAVLLLAFVAYVRGQYTCHGDVTLIQPTGASAQTASQDGLQHDGVSASQHMVDNDVASLNLHKACYEEAGRQNCIHPALIAAIASRESRGGKLLDAQGYGDQGRAYGIMQCDLHHSGLSCTSCAWDSCCHIEMMTRDILVAHINEVKAKHPSWTPEQWLQGAYRSKMMRDQEGGVAAYNFGVSNVQTLEGMDRGTTGHDYSNDVVARAQRLIHHHGW